MAQQEFLLESNIMYPSPSHILMKELRPGEVSLCQSQWKIWEWRPCHWSSYVEFVSIVAITVSVTAGTF